MSYAAKVIFKPQELNFKDEQRAKDEKFALVRRLRQANLRPGAPDWQETALERAERQAAELAANGGKRRPNQCLGWTTGTWGPKRPCGNNRKHGLTVCNMHGGLIPNSIKAAKQRFMEELDPSIDALREVRDQNQHMPSKLGAALKFIERAMGKQEPKKDEGSTRPKIVIGIAIGGIPQAQRELMAAQAHIEPDEEDIEGDVVEDDD